MKNIILIVLLFLLNLKPANADYFQIYDNAGGFYLAYSAVYVYDQSQQLIFSGYTDMYGRIGIFLPAGGYKAVLVYGGQQKSTWITIDGGPYLKPVPF
jgi:hypothetical protein